MKARCFSRAIGTVILSGLCVLCLTVASDAQSCTVSPLLVNSCGPWLGASAGSNPDSSVPPDFESQIKHHEGLIGRKLSIVHDYISVTDPAVLTSYDSYFINRTEWPTYLLVNLRLTDDWTQANGGNPTVDARINGLADSIKAQSPHKIMMSIRAEPEGSVSAGSTSCKTTSGSSGSPTDYVNMWHHIRALFNAKNVTNVIWVMVYQGNQWADNPCLTAQLYPGDGYVDWVGWDPYLMDTNPSDTFTSKVSFFYNLLASNGGVGHEYQNKPWMLSEYGVHDDLSDVTNGSEPTGDRYFTEEKAAIDANTFPKINAYVIFDNLQSLMAWGVYEPNRNDSSTWITFWDQKKKSDYTVVANDSHLQ